MLIPDLGLYLIPMIVVVSQGGVDVTERDRRYLGNDLVGRQALLLVPDDDVQHPHPMARDTGPASADAGRSGYPFRT